MTDKEIIIDGVNVNKCAYYEHDGVLTCNDYESCEDNPNCYFKQLKHKEQALDEIEKYCKKQNLKYDTTACYILGVIGEMKGLMDAR